MKVLRYRAKAAVQIQYKRSNHLLPPLPRPRSFEVLLRDLPKTKKNMGVRSLPYPGVVKINPTGWKLNRAAPEPYPFSKKL